MTAELLENALEWLRELGDVRPEEARERLGALRARYPGIAMRLVWQREAATDQYHYDLLFPSAEGTTSLAFAPDRAIPWPLRNSQRAGEQLVLRVNGTDMLIEQVISLLDVLWDDAALSRRLVNACLIGQAADVEDIDLPDDRLQEAMDAFRRARGLLTAQATRAWMAERGVSHAQLERIVAVEATVAALRQRVAGERVEDFFADHRDAFDRLRVVRSRYADQAHAEAAVARLRAADVRGAEVVAMATEESLAGLATSRIEGGYREDLITSYGAKAVEARAGTVIGPAALEGGFCFAYVLAVEPAVLDRFTRKFIEERLLDEWLREQRRHAHVEWFWGSKSRTDELTADLRS
ncbi:TIGR04500 family putative peptide maturation system protein [Streptosporangium sp. NPDC002607]